MPSYLDHFGKTLKVDDIRESGPQRLVIEDVKVEKIKSDSGEAEKLLVHFVGLDKALVLNRTNGDSICEIAGTRQYDDWGGTVVVLYVDETVTMSGKRVGGIRVRAPKKGAAKATASPEKAPEPEPEPEEDPEPTAKITEDDIPF